MNFTSAVESFSLLQLFPILSCYIALGTGELQLKALILNEVDKDGIIYEKVLENMLTYLFSKASHSNKFECNNNLSYELETILSKYSLAPHFPLKSFIIFTESYFYKCTTGGCTIVPHVLKQANIPFNAAIAIYLNMLHEAKTPCFVTHILVSMSHLIYYYCKYYTEPRGTGISLEVA